jgi:hypothetical protein
MKYIISFLLFFVSVGGFAQKGDVVSSMKKLHKMMVTKPGDFLMDLYIHDSLSYGHSNGWIESRSDFRNNMNSKYIIYHSFKEDSIHVVEEGKTTYIRFIADIDVTLNSKRATYHLKVLEVWVKKNKRWMLFARQAVKG